MASNISTFEVHMDSLPNTSPVDYKGDDIRKGKHEITEEDLPLSHEKHLLSARRPSGLVERSLEVMLR